MRWPAPATFSGPSALPARLLGCPTLGLSGRDGGDMAPLLDVELRAPSQSTHRIQELHLPMYHALCACVEACLFA